MVRFLLAALSAAAVVATLGTSVAEAGPLRRLICRDRSACDSGCGGGFFRRDGTGPLRRLFHHGGSSDCGCSTTASIDLPPSISSVSLDEIPLPMPSATMSAGIAQAKADTIAAANRLYHPGGSFGAGTREGVGFSTASKDDAIRRCCYWGQCEPIDIGVARGPSGWFACVIYR